MLPALRILGLLWLCGLAMANNYSENLYLTPLPRNSILGEFEFQVTSLPKHIYYQDPRSEAVIHDAPNHYTYFPRSIGPLLEHSNARELHLRFTQGWWDSELWGQLPNNGTRNGGTGVELWAVIEAKSQQEALDNWYKLAQLLSGFFCASLNFIQDSTTTFPINTFTNGVKSFKAVDSNKLFLLRAALPSEPICTENLTPFLKLLPTRGKAGIASLLDGHKVFDSLWHSMSIDFTTELVPETNEYNLKMEQTISVVIDIMRSIRKRKEGPIAKPIASDDLRCDRKKAFTAWQCFPLGLPTELKVDLRTIFGRLIKGSAFATVLSPITVYHRPEAWKVDIYEEFNINTLSGNQTYEALGDKEVDIKFDIGNTTVVPPIKQPPMLASRSLTGFSQDTGGFRVSFTNNQDKPIKFVYFESLPWFTRLYLNTMTASIKENNGSYEKVDDLNKYIELSYYHPAIDRKRPSHMELTVSLPPKKTLTLNYKFDKSLLLIAEYPPDANHGFLVDPAVITVLEGNKKVYEFRTTSSLVTLPTPDFSMPYNVIILTGTVLSLAFGSIFNLLIKDVITEEEFEQLARQSKVHKVILIVKAVTGSILSLVNPKK